MKAKKQIVIVGSSPTDTMNKLALMLKRDGYGTVLISITKGMPNGLEKIAYDKAVSFNANFFSTKYSSIPAALKMAGGKLPDISQALNEIRKLKPYAVIVVTTPNWLYFLAKKYFRNYPVIYFPFDIRSSAYKDIEDAVKNKIPRFELKAERFAFLNADGIIHKGGENELENLNKKILGKIKINCPHIYMFPYALNDLMVPINQKNKKKGKELNIVYVGHIPADPEFLNALIDIANQGINLHLYGKTVNLTVKEDEKRIKDNCKGIFDNNHIIFHEPVPQNELPKEISQYDYGLYGCSYNNSEFYATATGNKIASYLEAGIPFITTSQYKVVTELIKQYDMGVGIKIEEIKHLKKILENKDVNKFKKGIIEARKHLGFEENLPKIKEFLRQSVRYKERKNNHV